MSGPQTTIQAQEPPPIHHAQRQTPPTPQLSSTDTRHIHIQPLHTHTTHIPANHHHLQRGQGTTHNPNDLNATHALPSPTSARRPVHDIFVSIFYPTNTYNDSFVSIFYPTIPDQDIILLDSLHFILHNLEHDV